VEIFIHVDVDAKDWEAALDRWIVLAHEAAKAASQDGAEAIQKVTRAKLLGHSHPAHTRTPSPPGSPPAAISGELAASVDVRMEDDWALVGPTDSARSKRGAYGRFLEMGGDHEAKNASGYMTWHEDGEWYQARILRKGPRPYLKPATEDVIDSGELLRIYADHWTRAQAEI
jgi:hypothetical protein